MDKLIIFDADFLLYYATMGNKVFNEQGEAIKEDGKFVYTPKTVEEVYQAADDIINTILNKHSGDYYVGYLGNSKSFRYDVDPNYKANRKKLEKPMWFQELKDYLVSKWKFILLDNGLEADDAVNIVRTRIGYSYRTYIVTNDKDLVKCIHGWYINPKDCSLSHTKLSDAQYAFWTSMITGDSIDNIKGIPGKGKKFAEKLLVHDAVCGHLVREAYRDYFKEDGFKEFTKNFKLLNILHDSELLDTPELNKVIRKEKAIEETTDSSSRDKELW